MKIKMIIINIQKRQEEIAKKRKELEEKELNPKKENNTNVFMT